MADSGCLVTCIAAAASMETGAEVTPGQLNDFLSGRGSDSLAGQGGAPTGFSVYDGRGNLQWGPLQETGVYKAEIYDTVSEEILYDCLERGHYPIVRVRLGGLGSFHYVLVVGVEDGDFLCMDPMADDLRRLADYGGRVYAVRCIFRGEQEKNR